MNNQKYYLPIKSANLAHYLSKGCICPTKYLQNRNDDIQTKFENFLLLSNTKFTNETNCSLEIVFDTKIEKLNQISENFYLFDAPLPISRIKKILFQDEKQKVTTVFNITSGAAFLPNNLIEIDSNSESANSAQLNNLNIESTNRNWSSKLELFDRLMGGFAVMSIAGNDFQNYPLNYFNTLSVINNLVKDELTNQSVQVNNNYDWAIINNSKYISLYKAIYSHIDANLIEEFARKDAIRLEKSNGKYVLDKIDETSSTFLVAILASYGEGTRMTLDNFISDFNSNRFPDKRKEGIALIFGINKGYEAFRNRYKTQNFEVDIKFKLDSQLDYYTIESIYQFSFNNKKENYVFDYIDSWCVKLKEDNTNNDFESYQVLDKTIIYKKKERTGSQDLFQKLFQNTSRNKIYQKIIAEFNKLIPAYIKNKDDNEGSKYFMNLLEIEFEVYTKSIYEKAKEEIEKEFDVKLANLRSDKIAEVKKLEDIIQSQKNQIIKFQESSEKVIPEIDKVSISEQNNGSIDNEVTGISIVEESNFNNEKEQLNDTLFPVEIPKENLERKIDLKKLGITKLKDEAKKLNVKNLSNFKNTTEDIDKLIKVILQLEAAKYKP